MWRFSIEAENGIDGMRGSYLGDLWQPGLPFRGRLSAGLTGQAGMQTGRFGLRPGPPGRNPASLYPPELRRVHFP